MQNYIRAFIAVEINDAIRAELSGVQSALKEANGHVSWVRPENIHGTLVFLGDIFQSALDALSVALAQAVAGRKPFEIEIRGLGYFGSARSPRIIWSGIAGTGVSGQAAALIELQGIITAAVLQTGLKSDLKPFNPHLTIGRVRSNRNAAALVGAIEVNKDESFGKLVVRRAVLMKSVLSPQGPVYSVVQAAAFGTA